MTPIAKQGHASKVTSLLTAFLGMLALSLMPRAALAEPAIFFLGDSLTIGYGVAPEESYPSLIEQKIKAEGLDFKVINAGVSGDTSAGGLSRLTWILRQSPSVFFLALGANDGLRGLPPETTAKNLEAIINSVRQKAPNATIILAGMQTPPSMGNDYAEKYRATFTEVSQKTDCILMPFLLEGVAAVPHLNQADGIHPNAEGYKIIAENIWKVLKPILEKHKT